jgi:hypothetical protein
MNQSLVPRAILSIEFFVSRSHEELAHECKKHIACRSVDVRERIIAVPDVSVFERLDANGCWPRL